MPLYQNRVYACIVYTVIQVISVQNVVSVCGGGGGGGAVSCNLPMVVPGSLVMAMPIAECEQLG